jgi:hypothetical protein
MTNIRLEQCQSALLPDPTFHKLSHTHWKSIMYHLDFLGYPGPIDTFVVSPLPAVLFVWSVSATFCFVTRQNVRTGSHHFDDSHLLILYEWTNEFYHYQHIIQLMNTTQFSSHPLILTDAALNWCSAPSCKKSETRRKDPLSNS